VTMVNRSEFLQRWAGQGSDASFLGKSKGKGRLLRWGLGIWAGVVWLAVVGCSHTPSPERVPIPVLKDQGAIHRTGSGETLLWISRDRGYSVIELESLNPRWKGVTIAPGTEILLPVGKPMIRRVQKKSGGR